MSQPEGTSADKASSAPAPDHPNKPDSPTDITKPSWGYTLKKALAEFGKDECTDTAAGLTYFAVLSLFPALLALVSLLGVFGQGKESVAKILQTAGEVGIPEDSLGQIRPVIESMVQTQAAGFALVSGLLIALWSASNYVNAFSRAMNRVYEVDEGRPVWKLRPVLVGLTAVILLLVALIAVGLVVSGPVAETVGNAIGMGSTALTVWNIAKWPVILLIVILIVALLYYVTPNVKQPKFRWISVGAAIAILIWVLASLAFGFYVGNFGSYEKTYGSLAGVIVFLLWLWITNNALLFGAEVDAELERARQLQAGIKAEETLQLPPRDTRQSEKAELKRKELVDSGRQIRLEAEAAGATGEQAQAEADGGDEQHRHGGGSTKADRQH